ncbi:MAG: hypothetical protein JWP63_3518 [Candidatus Solibacter sp.]|nr:hypothetical protein [Candidatus Solibacter sp.]
MPPVELDVLALFAKMAWLGELERYGWHSIQDLKRAHEVKRPNIGENIWEVYCQVVQFPANQNAEQFETTVQGAGGETVRLVPAVLPAAPAAL